MVAELLLGAAHLGLRTDEPYRPRPSMAGPERCERHIVYSVACSCLSSTGLTARRRSSPTFERKRSLHERPRQDAARDGLVPRAPIGDPLREESNRDAHSAPAGPCGERLLRRRLQADDHGHRALEGGTLVIKKGRRKIRLLNRQPTKRFVRDFGHKQIMARIAAQGFGQPPDLSHVHHGLPPKHLPKQPRG